MALNTAERVLNQNTTAKFTAELKDEDGVAIPSASLDAMTLTLYDKRTGDIINSRDGQDILNTNNVTIDSSGTLTWEIQQGDTPIVNEDTPVGRTEVHIALFQWQWDTTKYGNDEILLEIRNMRKVD